MNPLVTIALAEAHRDEMLRTAERRRRAAALAPRRSWPTWAGTLRQSAIRLRERVAPALEPTTAACCA